MGDFSQELASVVANTLTVSSESAPLGEFGPLMSRSRKGGSEASNSSRPIPALDGGEPDRAVPSVAVSSSGSAPTIIIRPAAPFRQRQSVDAPPYVVITAYQPFCDSMECNVQMTLFYGMGEIVKIHGNVND
ncbi:unnamed protein product [Heligmosomoides polygyrus]|uniref:Uncharacterized protein n=1 Tax=Heligmosomoides polygyrus TaxID=6339 RepID=A0A183FNP2_HELPZ|nr:unnamed protein product [Heligmosomoides polygyrus]